MDSFIRVGFGLIFVGTGGLALPFIFDNLWPIDKDSVWWFVASVCVILVSAVGAIACFGPVVAEVICWVTS